MIDNYFVAQSMGYSGLEFTHTTSSQSEQESGGKKGGRAQVRFPEDQKLSCITIDTQRATQPAQLSATSQQQTGPMPDQTRPDQTRLYAVSESRPGQTDKITAAAAAAAALITANADDGDDALGYDLANLCVINRTLPNPNPTSSYSAPTPTPAYDPIPNRFEIFKIRLKPLTLSMNA